MYDVMGSTRSAAEWELEDRLAWELTEAALASPVVAEAPFVPVGIESWPADERLAVFLSRVDPDALSGSDRVRFMVQVDRLVAAGHGRFLGAVGSVGDAYDGLAEDVEDPDGGASMELRAALRVSRRVAETELGLAHDLRVRLPSLFGALVEGRVDRARAKKLADLTGHLSVAEARTVTDGLLADARRWTTGQLSERIRRACIEADPDSAKQRFVESCRDRRVESWPDTDGTVTLAGIGLDPVEVASAKELINRLARERNTAGEDRSMDQLRADVFTDLVNGRVQTTSGEGTTGVRAGSVHLLVDLATLAGMCENTADLAGYGPVAADIARQVTKKLGEGVWDWTATHPETGMPAADGTTRRRPTASQVRKVKTRNRTCVAPGCRMPTIDCDIDHTRPWADTGRTDSKDLAALCRHDHCIRHQTGWTYQRLADGDYLWTSPLGGHYTTSGNDPPPP